MQSQRASISSSSFKCVQNICEGGLLTNLRTCAKGAGILRRFLQEQKSCAGEEKQRPSAEIAGCLQEPVPTLWNPSNQLSWQAFLHNRSCCTTHCRQPRSGKYHFHVTPVLGKGADSRTHHHACSGSNRVSQVAVQEASPPYQQVRGGLRDGSQKHRNQTHSGQSGSLQTLKL